MGATLAYELCRPGRTGPAPGSRLQPRAYTVARERPKLPEQLWQFHADLPNPRLFELLRPGIEADIRMLNDYIH